MSEALYPTLASPHNGDLLVLLAAADNGQFSHLFLWDEGSRLEPIRSVVLEDTAIISRQARLAMEASSLGASVPIEQWLFIGWQEGVEVWLGFPSLWFGRSDSRLLAVSSTQLSELYKSKSIQTPYVFEPKDKRVNGVLTVGSAVSLPTWIGYLSQLMGWGTSSELIRELE